MNTWGVKCVVFAVVLTFLPNCGAAGDAEVSCVFMESCLLPCSFQAGEDPLVHWMDVKQENTYVHYYYRNKDRLIDQDQLDDQNQLGGQDQRFRGRTVLFRDQISRGNASLLLERVEVQDQGRYLCFTSSITSDDKKSYITLKVDAPVRRVDIQQEGNWITCRSEGIYPKPELSWSTSPPSTVIMKTPTSNRTEQQLYSISSSLMLPDKGSDLVYSCTVSTRSSWKTNTFNTTGQVSEAPADAETPGSDGAGSDGAGSNGAGSDGAGSDGAAVLRLTLCAVVAAVAAFGVYQWKKKKQLTVGVNSRICHRLLSSFGSRYTLLPTWQ